MTVPVHMVEIESEGSSNSTGSTAVVGTTKYFRLKDKRGYNLISYLFIYIFFLRFYHQFKLPTVSCRIQCKSDSPFSCHHTLNGTP